MALFLFADGAPIGEEGLYWLKVHTANCGDGCGADNKISKEPFATRVAWADAHRKKIEQTAKAPLETAEWWAKAAEPFQFLAACFELAGALAEGPTYITHLPVSFDGSCSGLQHLCAMIRAPEGGGQSDAFRTAPRHLPDCRDQDARPDQEGPETGERRLSADVVGL
jgi:DNA-directed RNA polymerase